jgi:RNA polymerase sigma-70 factor, ECF subfamily
VRPPESRTPRPDGLPLPVDVDAEPADSKGRPASPPRELLERARRREPEALAAFFDHYFQHLYCVVFRMVGGRELAEDVTQEVFLKVHRAIHRLDPARDPSGWLVAIAYNACRDLWRSGSHRLSRRATPIEEAHEALAHPGLEPDAALVAHERERLVQEAIVSLPPPFRVAVVLHDYAGLGHAEVAAITGVRAAAARKRYSRALHLLAGHLSGRLE